MKFISCLQNICISPLPPLINFTIRKWTHISSKAFSTATELFGCYPLGKMFVFFHQKLFSVKNAFMPPFILWYSAYSGLFIKLENAWRLGKCWISYYNGVCMVNYERENYCRSRTMQWISTRGLHCPMVHKVFPTCFPTAQHRIVKAKYANRAERRFLWYPMWSK